MRKNKITSTRNTPKKAGNPGKKKSSLKGIAPSHVTGVPVATISPEDSIHISTSVTGPVDPSLGHITVSSSRLNNDTKNKYVIYRRNSRLYVGRQNGNQLSDEKPFTAKTPVQLAGNEVVIQRKGMSRVEIASIIKAISSKPKY